MLPLVVEAVEEEATEARVDRQQTLLPTQIALWVVMAVMPVVVNMMTVEVEVLAEVALEAGRAVALDLVLFTEARNKKETEAGLSAQLDSVIQSTAVHSQLVRMAVPIAVVAVVVGL